MSNINFSRIARKMSSEFLDQKRDRSAQASGLVAGSHYCLFFSRKQFSCCQRRLWLDCTEVRANLSLRRPQVMKQVFVTLLIWTRHRLYGGIYHLTLHVYICVCTCMFLFFRHLTCWLFARRFLCYTNLYFISILKRRCQ